MSEAGPKRVVVRGVARPEYKAVPATWRLAASLGHKDYRNLELRPVQNPWEVALRYLDSRARRLLMCEFAERALVETRHGFWKSRTLRSAVQTARKHAIGESDDEQLFAAKFRALQIVRGLNGTGEGAEWSAAWAVSYTTTENSYEAVFFGAAEAADAVGRWGVVAKNNETARQWHRAAEYVLGEV